ncbi:hypothetical protein JWZ98_07565 [Methylomonas sp. EFPC1]|uniref:hypothetical protein n=1 Tax=Methylomonas sp. EFPC1 TaxID=2812647 RepID=UPI00196744A0|nr:hypothetical protein [Methylomonas sp. EFPC1]QSB02783.1 hypothetical protein JWZ98_07565 [Methylomonas sp. EFPC1]
MILFLENNWLSIVSILIGIIVSYVFYRFQKNDSISASVERKKHAIDELIDLVESYIINKQEISEDIIDNFVAASERSYSVNLGTSCSAISILQDVALRLQRSRHLDIEQKSEYSEKINQSILEIRDKSKPIDTIMFDFEIKDKFFELARLLEPGSEKESNELFGQIYELIDKHIDSSLEDYQDNASFRRLRAITSVLLGFAATFVVFIVGSKFLPELNALEITRKFVPVLVIAFLLGSGLTLVFEAIDFYRRKRNASHK